MKVLQCLSQSFVSLHLRTAELFLTFDKDSWYYIIQSLEYTHIFHIKLDNYLNYSEDRKELKNTTFLILLLNIFSSFLNNWDFKITLNLQPIFPVKWAVFRVLINEDPSSCLSTMVTHTCMLCYRGPSGEVNITTTVYTEHLFNLY